MSARKIPDGAGRVSVDLTPDGPMLTCDLGGGEIVQFEIVEGTAVELAACFFFVALLEPDADPERIAQRFGEIVDEKSRDYAAAQQTSRARRGPMH